MVLFPYVLAAYWQASHSGLSIEHATPGQIRRGDGGRDDHGRLPDIIVTEATLLSLPSVPFSVDFSTCVALRERR